MGIIQEHLEVKKHTKNTQTNKPARTHTFYRLLLLLLFWIYPISQNMAKQTSFEENKTLFNKTRHIFDKIFFFKYRTRQIKTTETNKKVMYLNRNGSLTKMK